jgi:hypothetical protein
MTEKGTVIAYDQGRYESWGQCNELGAVMVEELDKKYIHKCVEWKE